MAWWAWMLAGAGLCLALQYAYGLIWLWALGRRFLP